MPKCPYYPGVRIKCVNMVTKGTCRSVRIIRGSVLSVLIRTPRGHAEVSVLSDVRIKCVNMDTKGTCRSVRIIWGSVLSVLIRTPRGHAEVSVLSGGPY